MLTACDSVWQNRLSGWLVLTPRESVIITVITHERRIACVDGYLPTVSGSETENSVTTSPKQQKRKCFRSLLCEEKEPEKHLQRSQLTPWNYMFGCIFTLSHSFAPFQRFRFCGTLKVRTRLSFTFSPSSVIWFRPNDSDHHLRLGR